MSQDSSTTTTGAIGFFGLLAIVFITLKLTKVIAWSWVWVLAPLWIPLAIVLAIAVIVLGCLFVAQSRGENPFN